MPRIIAEDVKQIFTSTLEGFNIDAAIMAATNLVDSIVVTNSTPSMSTAELKEVERWLAAHFSYIHDPASLREVMGDSESWNFPASVTVAWSKGLGLTPYGQQAMLLDRTGTLTSLGKRRASYRAAPRENSADFTRNL